MAKKIEPRTTRQPTLAGFGRSTKDTVESIVIAFILAFVFRAFVVEAYRIPTGSMAPTLYGAHLMTQCPDCGYEYAFEVLQRTVQDRVINYTPRVTVCPNCRWVVHKPKIPMQGGRILVDGGDRILVMKLGYELADLFSFFHARSRPKRWDVVVFKNPAEPEVNFIKRLIGLPGEKIEIIDGDIYANDKIVRKTRVAQESLWFLVYNNDYFPTRRSNGSVDPRDLPGWVPADPASEALWETSGRVFSFHGNKPGTIVFNGPLQDFYAYDDPDNQYKHLFTVSDIKLRAMLNVHKGSGQMDLVLSKWNDVFIARVDSVGRAQLFRTTRTAFQAGKPALTLVTEGMFPPIRPKDPRILAFENVDYRVRLSIDDKVILQTTDEQYSPQPEKLRSNAKDEPAPIVQITARDFEVRLAHVLVLRDVYYRSALPNAPGREKPLRERPLRIQMAPGVESPFAGRPGYGTVGHPIHLGPADYFVLGDNSPESLDSRLWYEVGPHLESQYRAGRYHMGTVPADQMVGKAFFVYWPAGFRLFGGPPVIPNVGEMRFIR
jgi:signal peptidase I